MPQSLIHLMHSNELFQQETRNKKQETKNMFQTYLKYSFQLISAITQMKPNKREKKQIQSNNSSRTPSISSS